MTKFEDLEETHAEVRLKQALWKSQQDWISDYESWLNVSGTLHVLCRCIYVYLWLLVELKQNTYMCIYAKHHYNVFKVCIKFLSYL